MATTGIVNGKLFLFYKDGVVINNSTSGSIEFSAETRDITTKDSSDWAEKVPTILSATGSCEGLVALDATVGFSALFTAFKNKTKIGLTFSTDVVGDKYFSGDAYITSLTKDAPNQDNTTYSASFEFTGEVSELTNT